LSGFSACELGALVLQAIRERLRLAPDGVDEVIMGNVVSAGLGQNPARQAALGAGLSETTPAFTLNKVCGSGAKAIQLAAQAVRLGEASIVLAGGMESMTNAPHLIRNLRGGLRLGHAEVLDSMIHDGLWCPFENQHMGNAAEHTAQKHGISRREQDQFALESHQKACEASRQGFFREEIVPVQIRQRKGPPTLLSQDEGPRADTTLETLQSLKPPFIKEGTVTAGNASQISDGAAAVAVTSAAVARERGWEVLATIGASAVSGVAPKDIFDAPVPAIRKAFERAGLDLAQIDLIELNEAFAAQVLANAKALELDRKRLNPQGGAVALGHPIGCSGARIAVTLVHALRRRGGGRGIAAACLGGGNAIAVTFQS
jgi:acetyl-CoA C-acetyltransferase